MHREKTGQKKMHQNGVVLAGDGVVGGCVFFSLYISHNRHILFFQLGKKRRKSILSETPGGLWSGTWWSCGLLAWWLWGSWWPVV